jgi:hypothetical protein
MTMYAFRISLATSIAIIMFGLYILVSRTVYCRWSMLEDWAKVMYWILMWFTGPIPSLMLLSLDIGVRAGT